MMKENVSIVIRGFFTILMINFLTLILLFSLTTLAVGMGTETIGHIAYSVDKEGNITDPFCQTTKNQCSGMHPAS